MVGAHRGGRLIAAMAGLLLSLGGAVLFAQDPPAGEGGVIASKGTRTYHRPSCEAVKKISAKNKVELASPEEAASQKFKPCPICKPNVAAAPPGEADPSEKPDASPIKGKTKKTPGKPLAKKGNAEAGGTDADAADGAMPKAKGKKGAAKGSSKKADAAAPAPADDKAMKFSRDIAPILVGNCTGCHNAQQRKGQFDMTNFQKLMAGSTKQKVIVPGNPDESLLILKVRGEQPAGGKMPPGQRNLAPETITKIEEWIKSGARLDAGFEPTAALETIAPTPEAIRRAEMAKLTPDQRDKALEEAGLERWKKASAKTTPVVTSGKNFLLFSNLPKERGERLLKTMETQRTLLSRVLGPAGSASFTGPEKVSLYVFNDIASYVEFVRTIENREIEAGIEGHGKLDVEHPYVAATDPLNGADEPASAATPKKTARSKKAKAAEEEAPDGADRTLAGLLSENLAASAATAAGKPPRWLTYGLGAYLSSQVDPKGSSYYSKLRQEAVAQYAIGWVPKTQEALGGEGNPETIRAIGFSLCEWLGSTAGPRFPYFVQGMLQGGEKLDDVIRKCFGEDVTREQFLTQWGGFVATRYGAGRRR